MILETVYKNINPADELPEDLKPKAVDLLLKTGKIWNSNKELIIDDSVVENSNIVQILTYYLGQRKGEIPIGYRDFLLYLHKTRIHKLEPPGEQLGGKLIKTWISL